MELRILDQIQSLRHPILDSFFTLATRLGDGGIIWIGLAALLIFLPKKRKCGAALVLSLIVDLILCNLILKPLAARTRPFDINEAVMLIVSRPRDYSFPSGHTAASFASTVSLWLSKEKWLSIFALIVSLIIAFSRLYLYVHYPTDVLGGIAVGIISGVIGYLVMKYVDKLHKAHGESGKGESEET